MKNKKLVTTITIVKMNIIYVFDIGSLKSRNRNNLLDLCCCCSLVPKDLEYCVDLMLLEMDSVILAD